jgi:hypothetical protein
MKIPIENQFSDTSFRIYLGRSGQKLYNIIQENIEEKQTKITNPNCFSLDLIILYSL